MDRQFDFRALLVKIQDRLSNDDRHRLHFLVGDIIPRMQRENVTLAGTLTLLESLFDRAVINEDYLDFLIRIFGEIQCYDAVKRLQEYQSAKEPFKQRTTTLSDVLNDNDEEDKHQSTHYTPLMSEDNHPILLDKPDELKKMTAEMSFLPYEETNPRKMTTTDSFPIAPNTSEIIEKPPQITTAVSSRRKFLKLPLINCLYILLFLEILLSIICLWIFIRKKFSLNYGENQYHRDVYILKNGKFPDSMNGKWFNHSEDLLLTYTDRLMRIDARVYGDDMYSIKFLYSQNKSMEHTLKNLTRLNKQTTLSSLDFEQHNIQEIAQCYKGKNASTHLVGLFFAFKDKSSSLLGSCHDQIYLEDKFSNHIFGYALGRTAQYLNGFQFVWYKICSLDNRVTFCGNHISYNLDMNAVYKD